MRPPSSSRRSESSRSAPHWWEGPRGETWVVVQLLLLLAIALAPRPADGRLGLAGWPAIIAGAALLSLGGGLAGAGAIALGRQLTPLPAPGGQGRLVVHGPYRLVRHPIYGGLLLLALGTAIITDHPLRLALALALGLFFDAKARREERWLAEHFPDYAQYQRQVSRLIPWIY